MLSSCTVRCKVLYWTGVSPRRSTNALGQQMGAGMRLQRATDVAGMDPEVERRIVRACHTSGPVPTETVAYLAQMDRGEVEELLERLADAGFLGRRILRAATDTEAAWWYTTLSGGALANASFLKPIGRAKAQSLLGGVLERARAYNADPDKPLWIERISVFGSFLNAEATTLGDIDLNVVLVDRECDDPQATRNRYTRASGRRFMNIVEELAWPETEARRVLKNRSGYISIHQEDLARFTDRSEVVFARSRQPGIG